MRRACLWSFLVVAALLFPRPARADDGPVRVAIECQGWGRTKACPAFLLGFVEHNPLFLSAPRGDADVVLYVAVTTVANVDHLLLRFVGEMKHAPPVVEVELDLDTRTDDDTQRAQLEPAFTRGIALYVAARHPEAVTIGLTAPAAEAVVAPQTTPWGVEASVGGYGNWTRGYQQYSAWSSASVSRVDKTSQLSFDLSGNGSISRQPALILDDGTQISLDTDQYAVAAAVFGERHLDAHWALGGMTQVWHEDPEGQIDLGVDARVGIEWDLFPADDPRGNRLAVAYMAGFRHDRYNVENELEELRASYPVHHLAAGGSVRKDKIGFGLWMAMRAEVIHPRRRHTLSASPYVEWQLGDHVDVSFSISLTKRAIPGPGELDESNYEQVIRATYAEPFSAYGSFNLRFHWDRTNGERNDRFSDTR